MAWTYRQKTGWILHDGELVGRGYSGHAEGLNDPTAEDDKGIGPIPRGRWRIGVFGKHPRLGPLAAPLAPVDHDAHGRTEFFIHGDNAEGNRSASHGCIVVDRMTRIAIQQSGDRELVVERG